MQILVLVPSDYRIVGTRSYFARVGFPTTTSVNLVADSIGQESEETFGLQLLPLGRSPPGFFIDFFSIVIQDKTSRFSIYFKVKSLYSVYSHSYFF